MKKVTNIKNSPNQLAVLIASAFQNSKISSILEYIDNSIDANSSKISISYNIQKGEFIVKDNGTGIPKKEISKIMSLGYQHKKLRNTSIGHWGAGLNGASYVLCNEKSTVKIETKTNVDSTTFIYEPILKPNKIEIIKSEKRKNVLTGTKITINNVNQIYDVITTSGVKKYLIPNLNIIKNNNSVEQNMAYLLGLYYFNLLDEKPKLKIFFNDIKVNKIDPLYRNSNKTIQINDEVYVGNTKLPIIATLIKQNEPKKISWWDNSNNGWKSERAGVYVCCGGRYINVGNGFGGSDIVNVNGHNTRIRIEIIPDKKIYKLLGINFNKSSDIKIPKTDETNELIEKIQDIVKKLKTLDSIIKKATKSNNDITIINEIKNITKNNKNDVKSYNNIISKLKEKNKNNKNNKITVHVKNNKKSIIPISNEINKIKDLVDDDIINDIKTKPIYTQRELVEFVEIFYKVINKAKELGESVDGDILNRIQKSILSKNKELY